LNNWAVAAVNMSRISISASFSCGGLLTLASVGSYSALLSAAQSKFSGFKYVKQIFRF
jgi:hypothetical protein